MENHTDLTSMVQKIMADPAFASMVSELRGDSGEKGAEEISGEMMKKLPDVLGILAPMLSGTGMNTAVEQTEKEQEKAVSSDDDREKLPPMQVKGHSLLKKYDKNRAEKLLAALKPYLSPSRCTILDQCMTVMKLTDVMSAVQGLESVMKSGTNGGK